MCIWECCWLQRRPIFPLSLSFSLFQIPFFIRPIFRALFLSFILLFPVIQNRFSTYLFPPLIDRELFWSKTHHQTVCVCEVAIDRAQEGISAWKWSIHFGVDGTVRERERERESASDPMENWPRRNRSRRNVNNILSKPKSLMSLRWWMDRNRFPVERGIEPPWFCHPRGWR